MFTQRCRNDTTVTWNTCHFCLCTSEQVSKVSTGRYLRKLYLQPIFESLLMTCAKTCKNWWMYVKPIARSNLRHFSETHCTLCNALYKLL